MVYVSFFDHRKKKIFHLRLPVHQSKKILISLLSPLDWTAGSSQKISFAMMETSYENKIAMFHKAADVIALIRKTSEFMKIPILESEMHMDGDVNRSL